MKEKFYDGLLNIRTRDEQNGFPTSLHYHRYEPTPYHALEILFDEYELTEKDRIVDFGSGKGRLNFYLHHLFHTAVVGIEMNPVFYQEALHNREQYLKKRRLGKGSIEFHCCLAEEYEIQRADNRFYFFNPFSVQIFRVVIHNILRSMEKFEREVEIILYYASEDYVYVLEQETPFELTKEILLPGLYEHNPFERFLIYRWKV